MRTLLQKLSYKGQSRIVVVNSEKNVRLAPYKELKEIRIDNEIDPRYPYGFMIVFVKEISEVELYSQATLHNLTDDGVLWFCFPKKTSKKFKSEISRDHGWKALNDLDFFGVRLVSIDDDWAAFRFRHKKYIKSTSDRFPK